MSEINEEELERRKDEGYKSGYIIGKFGLERIYDKEVRGINGGDQVEVDVIGAPCPDPRTSVSYPGKRSHSDD